MERHLAGCAACAELARDSAAAVAFMERAAEVEPPPELVTRILFDPPWATARPRPGAGLLEPAAEPAGSPILQPRFAMGMAMTILSFAMLAKFVRPVRQLDAEGPGPGGDLAHGGRPGVPGLAAHGEVLRKHAAGLPDPVHGREWQQQDDAEVAAEPERSGRKADERRLPVAQRGAPGQRYGKAEIEGDRHYELLRRIIRKRPRWRIAALAASLCAPNASAWRRA